MASSSVEKILDSFNSKNVELKDNGYYLVDTGDAYLFINSNCDVSNASMYVGLPGLGGDITPNDYSGRPYYEMFNSTDTTGFSDFNIIPKNMHKDTSKYISTIDNSGVNVTNAIIKGYSGSVPTALNISDSYVLTHPNVKTSVFLDDFDFSGQSSSTDYYKANLSKYSALAKSDASIYCLQHAGVNWGERDAKYLSENGFDNVALITTNSNNHGNMNYDILKSNIMPATAGLVDSSIVGGVSRNKGVGELRFDITRYSDGNPVGKPLSVSDYTNRYVGGTTARATQLKNASNDLDISSLFTNLKTSSGGIKIYRDELDAFINSSMLSNLTQDIEETKGISNLIKSFRNNMILKGDSWKPAYDKLDMFDNALTERMNAADELGEAISFAITTLQACMKDYDMMDTSQLPELKVVFEQLKTERDSLNASIEAGATKTVSKGVDKDGKEILDTVTDYDQINAWKSKLAEIDTQIEKANKLITSLEELERKYKEIEKVLDAAMAKVAKFSSSAASIPPSLRYSYQPITMQL